MCDKRDVSWQTLVIAHRPALGGRERFFIVPVAALPAVLVSRTLTGCGGAVFREMNKILTESEFPGGRDWGLGTLGLWDCGSGLAREQSCFRLFAGRARSHYQGLAPNGSAYAVVVSSSCDALPLMAICRGFMISGISRTRSMFSRPFSRVAPVTLTWSASWKTRSKLRPAIP